jgi:hypothetical protein
VARAVLAGVCLLIASVIGVVVAAGLEPFATDGNVVVIFRVAFTLASGTAALLCTWSVGWLLEIDRPWRTAALVATATATTYLVYALLIDPLPGFHVGGGNMAMPRVALLGNLLAGGVGAALAFLLFKRAGAALAANY